MRPRRRSLAVATVAGTALAVGGAIARRSAGDRLSARTERRLNRVADVGPYALPADPPVWDDYRAAIRAAGLDLTLEPIEKWDFYEAVATPDHVLTIQTADQQRFANVLLTIGVRMD